MVRCADEHADRWQPGMQVDMGEEMMRLTLRIVGLTLFSRDVEADASGIGQALTDLIGTFEFMLMPGAGLLRHLPLPAMRRAKQARLYLDAVVDRLISERGGTGDDLLATMLRATGDEGKLSPSQVRDQIVTLLLAGHATALTWTWYLLSQNPEADAKMRDELDRVLGGRLPRFEDVQALEYTDRVFAESLRLYPPAWALGRMAARETRIFNYVLAPGTIVVLSPYTMHRHERYWPEPERFDPDRFLPENMASRPRFSFFPFGGGPRTCIGERFAWTEGVLLLATLAQRRRPQLAAGQRVATHPRITLRPRFGMRMLLE
jgi:cytochrome P450